MDKTARFSRRLVASAGAGGSARIAIALAGWGLMSLAAHAVVATGSYTCAWTGTAPDPTTIRITAKTKEKDSHGLPLRELDTGAINVSGLTQEQAMNNIRAQIPTEWKTTLNGGNSTNITGWESGNRRYTIGEVDAGSTRKDYKITLDGTVPTTYLNGGGWIVAFTPEIGVPLPTAGLVTIGLTVPGVAACTSTLPSGSTPESVAAGFTTMLTAAGYDATQIDANRVAFSHDPTGRPIDRVDEFYADGPGIHYGMELPVPTPGSLAILVIAGVSIFRRRR